jgi:hypothetical protein
MLHEIEQPFLLNQHSLIMPIPKQIPSQEYQLKSWFLKYRLEDMGLAEKEFAVVRVGGKDSNQRRDWNRRLPLHQAWPQSRLLKSCFASCFWPSMTLETIQQLSK